MTSRGALGRDDTGGVELFCRVHLAEGGRLTAEQYGVATDAGVAPSCMCHVVELFHYVIMNQSDVSWLWLVDSEVHQSGIVEHFCKEGANVVDLGLRVSICLHYGAAALEVLGVLNNVICILRLHIFGSSLGGLSIWIPSLPSLVGDTYGESTPGKGGEDDLVVLNVCSGLLIQAEGPQVTINDEIQLGLRL